MNPPQPTVIDILSSPIVLWVLGILVTIIGTLTGLLYKSITAKMEAAAKGLAEFQREVSRDYIPRSDARELRSDLMDIMKRFEVTLGDRVKDLENVQSAADHQITELRILQAQCGRCNIPHINQP